MTEKSLKLKKCHVPRTTGQGGGVAFIFQSGLLIDTKPIINYNTLELLSLSVPS